MSETASDQDTITALACVVQYMSEELKLAKAMGFDPADPRCRAEWEEKIALEKHIVEVEASCRRYWRALVGVVLLAAIEGFVILTMCGWI